MAEYRISGVWKDVSNVITHYAFHKVNSDSTSRAKKTSKVEAIKLLETAGNSAVTWVWNYSFARFVVGESVNVVHGSNGKYLRSNPDSTVSDNLGHLIDYDWIQ